MAIFADNCPDGATDKSSGKCTSNECDRSRSTHRPDHASGCHLACLAPGYEFHNRKVRKIK